MNEVVLPSAASHGGVPVGLSVRLGWRNLWRNPRRTWLTAGGIGFAVLLVVVLMSVQIGTYDIMVDNATALLTGHIQLQDPAYVEQEQFDDTLVDVTTLLRRIAAVPGVAAATARVEVFALASAGERSFGAQIMGVDADAEAGVVRFQRQLTAGRMPAGPEEGLLGEGLARNLGVGLGDEVVILGGDREGGVAALVLSVTGLFSTGTAELDRALLWAPIESVRRAFGLGDEAHTVVVRTTDLDHVEAVAAAIRDALASGNGSGNGSGSAARATLVRTWDSVLPDVRQAIEIDRISGAFMYWLIMVLVAFSVVNTFIMTIFERTREFGMLRALGMGPGRILSMLQWEALFLWMLGTSLGLGVALVLVGWLRRTGIPLGAEMEALTATMYITDRIYPALSAGVLLTAPLVMLVGTQIAAALPSLRVWRLKPVDALRIAA